MAGNLADEARERIEREWEPLREAVDRLSAGGMETPTTPGWNGRQSVAHVAFWDEAAYGFMLLTYYNEPLPGGWTFGSGWLPGDEPWPHFEVHNRREAEWARDRTGRRGG